MPPLDPDDLAELAFDADAAQLDAAERAALDAYRRVIDAARSASPDQPDDEDAPDHVWSAISGELFSGDTTRTAQPTATAPSAGTTLPPAEPLAEVTPIRRRRPAATTLATIAAAIVLLGGVMVLVTNRDDAPPTETAKVVAQAELGLLPPGDPAGAPGSGSGTAELERTGSRLDIVLQTTDVTTPPPGAHYEVWLLNRTGPVQPQPIGVMETPNGTMRAPVPPTVDTAKFDVVDISVEPDDGNHDHSGHSLLRGTLQ